MQCPCCHDTMDAIEYEGVNIDTCPGCGGEFLGSKEIAHIARTREERFPESMCSGLAESVPTFGVDEEETERELNCPNCSKAMRVVNYAGDTGVHIDKCPACAGIWLDHEELEHIQVLVEQWADKVPEQLKSIAGELEDARQRAAELSKGSFQGSRFAFVNAIINRCLDAA